MLPSPKKARKVRLENEPGIPAQHLCARQLSTPTSPPTKKKKKRYLARAKSFIRNRSGDQVELRRPFTAQGDAGVDLTSLSCHAKMLTVSVTVHLARVHGVYTCPEPISVSSPAVFPLFFTLTLKRADSPSVITLRKHPSVAIKAPGYVNSPLTRR